jgi:hypothetical protein
MGTTHTRTTDVGSERRRLYALRPQGRSIRGVQMSEFLLACHCPLARAAGLATRSAQSRPPCCGVVTRHGHSPRFILFLFRDCISISSWPAAVDALCTLLDAAGSQGLSVQLRWLAGSRSSVRVCQSARGQISFRVWACTTWVHGCLASPALVFMILFSIQEDSITNGTLRSG